MIISDEISVKIGNISEEEFLDKQKRRYFYLKSKGYKEIRIISESDNLKSDNEIIKFCNHAYKLLKDENLCSIRWDMDINKVSMSYSKYVNYDYFINIKNKEEYYEFVNSIAI